MFPKLNRSPGGLEMRNRKSFYFQSMGAEETFLLRWFETVYKTLTDKESVEIMVTHVAAQFYLSCCVKNDKLHNRSRSLLTRIGTHVTSVREDASWTRGQATEVIQEAAYGVSAIAADFAACRNPFVFDPVELTAASLRKYITERAQAYRALLRRADEGPHSEMAALMKSVVYMEDFECARNAMMDHMEACIHMAKACDTVRENCAWARAGISNP
jgi:hypothetical protein